MHKLEEIRKKLNINKTEMARRLGITKSNYSMIIGERQGVSKKVALAAYKELRISIEDLLELLYLQVHADTTSDTGTEG